jgi:hypothetical protein
VAKLTNYCFSAISFSNLFSSFVSGLKKTKLKYLIFIISLILCSANFAGAQDISGIWRGYFVTEYGEEYKIEMQVSITGKSTKGVSYSYLDKRFYGKAIMTGQYVKQSKNLKTQELKTVEVRNLGGGGTCLMNYNLVYESSGREEFLTGSYLGKSEDRSNPKNNGKWGDCGGGKVYLRRVKTSEFYVEPFLRKNNSITKNNTKPVQKNTPAPAIKKTTPPVVKKTTPPVTNPIQKKVPPPIVKNTPIVKPKADTIKKTQTPVIVKKDPDIKPQLPKPEILKTRANELTKMIVVNSEEVVVKLFDNGEIDGDTISVYLDNKLVLSKKLLTAKALTVNLRMDEDNSEHELVMVAENLGRIPPNTSLMIVTAGDKKFEVRITSTEQKNAMVKFRYQKAVPQPVAKF